MILSTGAAGRVAAMVRPQLAAAGLKMRLTDRVKTCSQASGERFVKARLERARDCQNICDGSNAIIHLAGSSDEHAWPKLVSNNVSAVANLFDEAMRGSCRQIIFASTMHVLGMYPREMPLHEDMPPAPDTHYAVSKLAGEALCRLYAAKYDLDITILRLGHVVDDMADASPGLGIHVNDLTALLLHVLRQKQNGLQTFHAVAPHPGRILSDGRLELAGFCFSKAGPSREEIEAQIKARSWLGPLGQRIVGHDLIGCA